MTTAQSLKIYEILAARFGDTEDAKKVVEAIEMVIEDRTDLKYQKFESLVKKDFELVRSEIKEQGSRLETKIAESQTANLRWLFGFFITLALMLIGLYLKK